jgi:hypothetical protein
MHNACLVAFDNVLLESRAWQSKASGTFSAHSRFLALAHCGRELPWNRMLTSVIDDERWDINSLSSLNDCEILEMRLKSRGNSNKKGEVRVKSHDKAELPRQLGSCP